MNGRTPVYEPLLELVDVVKIDGGPQLELRARGRRIGEISR